MVYARREGGGPAGACYWCMLFIVYSIATLVVVGTNNINCRLGLVSSSIVDYYPSARCSNNCGCVFVFVHAILRYAAPTVAAGLLR